MKLIDRFMWWLLTSRKGFWFTAGFQMVMYVALVAIGVHFIRKYW